MVIARCQQNVLCFIPSFPIRHFIFFFYFLPSFGSALISLARALSFSLSAGYVRETNYIILRH